MELAGQYVWLLLLLFLSWPVAETSEPVGRPPGTAEKCPQSDGRGQAQMVVLYSLMIRYLAFPIFPNQMETITEASNT